MWTWWEITVAVLLLCIAINTMFTGTDDNVQAKFAIYRLLGIGVVGLALLLFGVPRLFK